MLPISAVSLPVPGISSALCTGSDLTTAGNKIRQSRMTEIDRGDNHRE